DHSLSPTRKLSWYYAHYGWNQANANGFTQVFTSAVPNAYRNHTTRVNYDESLRPTLLLHVGIGYLHQREPTIPITYDQTKLGLRGYFVTDLFPTIGGLYNNTAGGGLSLSSGAIGTGLGGGFKAVIYEEKPTANLSLTWVKGNHSFKYGGEVI